MLNSVKFAGVSVLQPQLSKPNELTLVLTDNDAKAAQEILPDLPTSGSNTFLKLALQKDSFTPNAELVRERLGEEIPYEENPHPWSDYSIFRENPPFNETVSTSQLGFILKLAQKATEGPNVLAATKAQVKGFFGKLAEALPSALTRQQEGVESAQRQLETAQLKAKYTEGNINTINGFKGWMTQA